MTNSLLIPLDVFGHHGGADWAGGPPPFFPFIGVIMFILAMLFIGSLFFLARKGKVGPPPWLLDRHSPEAEARRILAQRFAQSEITTEEFMERASVLNWTPGNEAFPPRDGKKKR